MEMVPLGIWNATNISNIYIGIFSNKTELKFKVQYGGLKNENKQFNFLNSI